MKKKILLGMTLLLLTSMTGCSKEVQAETVTELPDFTIEPIIQTELATYMTCLVDPTDLDPIFELSDYERWVVECMIMGEAEGESWDGKVLVAQCILNACLFDGLQPSEVREEYQYSGWNENPSKEVEDVVTSVFDNGHTVTDEPILWFYAPKYCSGGWHETQCHVITEGGHKFFKAWS